MKRKEIQLRVTISYPENEESDIMCSDPVWTLEDAVNGRYNYCVESVGFLDNDIKNNIYENK